MIHTSITCEVNAEDLAETVSSCAAMHTRGFAPEPCPPGGTIANMKPWHILTVVALVSIATGIGIGWTFARRQVVHSEKIVTSSSSSSSSDRAVAYVGSSSSRVENHTTWKTVTRWLKDGTVEQTRQAAADTTTATAAAVQVEKHADTTTTAASSSSSEKTTAPATRDRWLLGASVVAARELVQGKLPPIALDVDRRIIGPVWVHAEVRWPLEAAVGLAASF